MKEQFESSSNLDDIKNFLIQLTPDDNPWVEIKEDTLIVSGVDAFVHTIIEKQNGIMSNISRSDFFTNVRWGKGGTVTIIADLKNPMNGVNKIIFTPDKDM